MLHGVAAPTPGPLKARKSVTAETLTFIMWTARSASRFVAGRRRMPRERIAEHLSERAPTAAGIHVIRVDAVLIMEALIINELQ